MHTKTTPRHKSLAFLLVPLLLALPLAANAAFIDFSGAVTDGGGTQFSADDPLTGVIELDDAAAPGSMFDASDVLGFDFTVGSTDFALPDVTPFSSFRGTVADDGMSLSDFMIVTNLGGTIPGCGSCSLNLSNLPLQGFADLNSFTVHVLGFPNFGIAEGTLSTSVRAANNVAEPSVIAMFALALILLGWGARQRQSR